MQTDPLTRDAFVCYAAYDAKSTWEVRDSTQTEAQSTGLGAHGEQPLVDRHAGDDVGLLRALLVPVFSAGRRTRRPARSSSGEREFDVDLPASELPVVDEGAR